MQVTHEEIRQFIAGMPEVDLWPELATIFDRAGNVARPDWNLPVLACQAVGGSKAAGLPGAAAIACLQLSIIIVDDILDNDPRGAHNRYGKGPSANMALAYQSIATSIISEVSLPESDKLRAISTLNRAALATAVGQNADIQNYRDEESYWMVVKAKSTPFYGAALELGSILGSAPAATSSHLYDLGVIIGEIIQVEDDINDALEVPANADWKMGRNNLLLLYADTIDFEEKERFRQLVNDIDNPKALSEAQQILISCGAVSYAAYQLIGRYRKAKNLLENLSLAEGSFLYDILDEYAQTLLEKLKLSQVELSLEALIEL
jgi:geranylgeranyl pyrophosphate synthase